MDTKILGIQLNKCLVKFGIDDDSELPTTVYRIVI